MVVNRFKTMGGRAGGGSRGSSGAGGGQYNASALGRAILKSYTQSIFDESAALTPKQGASVGIIVKSSQITTSARKKLKASGWTPRRMESLSGKWSTQWESPHFKSLGDLQSHVKGFMGNRK